MVDNKKRVISPFLTVYRPQYSSMFSIFERITGIVVTGILVLYLLSVAKSDLYLSFYSVYCLLDGVLVSNSFLFQLGYFLFILSMSYHTIFGLRFIYWDRTGGVLNYGINLKVLYLTNNVLLVISFSIALVAYIASFTYFI